MIAAAANLAWLASHAGARQRFRQGLASPATTQGAVLKRLLQRNEACEFGRRHRFSTIGSPQAFASKVPLAAYDDFAPWIERIRLGGKCVLTTDEVTHLIPTSGSSGPRKLIPFTNQLQREFDAAIAPWIVDLYCTLPGAMFGPSYWSISPVVQRERTEESAVPIGFADDSHYLGGVRRRIVAAALAAPGVLRQVTEMETFFLLTLVSLLRRADLRLVSVWHPSFFLLLLDALPRHWDDALGIISDGFLPRALPVSNTVFAAFRGRPDRKRAAELSRLGLQETDKFWPHLAVISCWTDAHAALGAAEIRRRFPGVAVQPKGLLATEGFVTFPFAERHPVAVGSHYFEFIDETGAVHPVDALREGERYEVVISNGGGLWRYRLGDHVRVDGFVGRTPSLRFLGRMGSTCDFFGEKLSEEFAVDVIARLTKRSRDCTTRFAVLAPHLDGASGFYSLYWEGDGSCPDATLLDQLLAENPNYAWCRQLGQLNKARVVRVRSGAIESYFRRAASAGCKLGEIKPPALSHDQDLSAYLTAL